MERGRLLLRGPGTLAAVFLLAAAATVFSRHNVQAVRAGPLYSLRESGSGSASDPLAHTRINLQRMALHSLPNGSAIEVTLQVSVQDLGRTRVTVNPNDIFLVDARGSSYTPDGTAPRAVAEPHAGTILSLGFSLPISTRWAEIEWNDGGRLIPPATIAVLRMQPAGR